MADKVKTWLTHHAVPLWLERGVNWERGGFYEALSLAGQPTAGARRAMVQARQIFTFRTALDLGFCHRDDAIDAVATGAEHLIARYSDSSGAFIHAVDENGVPVNRDFDLYTQGFCLFGLANAYALAANSVVKARAKSLLTYLRERRALAGGGFTEIKASKTTYESNPHMHLFEAAIYWMEADTDPDWRNLADAILHLALEKFIDPATGTLAEHFDGDWSRQLEHGKFIWEPGHQYEWAWLIGRYEKLTGKNLKDIRIKLFENSEKYGLAKRGSVNDQMWSDFTAKTESSRFWPQCERIKAASQFYLQTRDPKYKLAATQAMETLFRFFDVPTAGLWFDTWQADGQFLAQPAKASSFYHIIGAMAEYLATEAD